MITKDELTVKIIDFGSCKDMDGTEFEKKFDLERQKQKSKKPTYKNFVGTPNYMAPECVRNKNSDFKSDMWSIGCLLYQMFTGFPPFLGKSDYLIFQKSTMAKYSSPENVIPSDAIDLISKLIVVDPSMRLTMSEVYNHAFLINENQDENFRKIYPQFTEVENVLVKIKNDLKKKYSIFKSISSKLDRIKNYEIMEEDCKKNGVDEEPNNPLTKDDKQLIIEKPNLLEKYDSGLKQLKSDIQQIKIFILSHNKISLRENIHQYDLSNSDVNEKKILLDKINFFEKQILHDLFNLDYEGEL
jgi:serine/threonine protein kinase